MYVFSLRIILLINLNPLNQERKLSWLRGFKFINNYVEKIHRLVEMGDESREKKIFRPASMYFLLFRYYLPLEKGGVADSFVNTWIPFTHGGIVPSLVEIDSMVLPVRTCEK